MDRDELISSHQHLVPLTVKRALPRVPAGLDAEDLESVGYVALVQAADRYDPARGAKFGAYVIAKIRGALLEYLRAQDWAPRSVRAREKRGEAVTVQRQVSLEALAGDEEGSSLLDRLADDAAGPQERALQAFETELLRALLAWLPARERRLCRQRYEEGRTLVQIAADFGLSESRVHQLHQRALGRVQAWVRDRCQLRD